MKHSTVLLLTLILIPLVFTPTRASVRYLPRQGDYFSYHEIIDLNGGTGDYTGYTEHDVVDGTERMNQIYGNGTIAAHWAYSYTWNNSTGSSKSDSLSGDYTWSSTSFLYEHGTDNQTGYVNPTVWFYMDNTTQRDGAFYLLNTGMTVQSTSYSYRLPSESRYVYAISSQGSSSYLRNDVYGRFNAAYTWTVYFDPSTGYIIGYDYTEQDTNPTAGFTWTDTLYVTAASYSPATAPPPPLNLLQYAGLLTAIVLVVIVLAVAIIILARRRARHPLPEHPSHAEPIGVPQYSRPLPPPGPPQPQQSIDLTPKQQPPVQQIVIKEVVKVKCRYCGALIDSTAQLCPYCGAPRT